MQTDDLKTLEASLLSEIATAGDLGAIETVRISALGKKGRVAELMQKLGGLPADERKAFGAKRRRGQTQPIARNKHAQYIRRTTRANMKRLVDNNHRETIANARRPGHGAGRGWKIPPAA